MKIKGKTWKFGDNIDTDAIVAARYLISIDPQFLGSHLMEDIRAGFVKLVKAGDILVGGKNFGCGSSREHAPLAVKGAGVSAVIAASFARIFYRNAFNMGLTIFVSPEASEKIREGDEVEIDAGSGKIKNLTRGESYQAEGVPPFIQDLIKAGGLIKYVVGKRKSK
jgi:3-isopropylmalate dehydratase small subunit